MIKAYVLLTVCGPRVILTSYNSIDNPELLKRLCAGGFTKFVAHEVSVDSTKAKYGMHFNIVCNDPHESDDLRILDYKGERAYKLFSFKELGPPIYYESSPDGSGYLWLYPRLSPSFLSANL
ncbi:unnamed protein product [marine sediment metagenome]|uniref:Uncharacterized protein n=1 Tax=marine sediment metagenome TaxID=412755 RepID=X1KWV6_9ZZZZ